MPGPVLDGVPVVYQLPRLGRHYVRAHGCAPPPALVAAVLALL